MGLRREYLKGIPDTPHLVHTLHQAHVTVDVTAPWSQPFPPTGPALTDLMRQMGLGARDTLRLRGDGGWSLAGSPSPRTAKP